MKWASAFSLLAALTASMAACAMHTKDSQPASEVRSGELSPEERYPTSLHARGPSDPVPGYPSEDPENWTYIGNVPDVTQDFKDYVDPLTQEQMEKLMIDYSE